MELGSHAATERVALVTLHLTVSRARILSRHPHATFRGSRRRVTASGDPVLGGVILRGDPTTNLPGTLHSSASGDELYGISRGFSGGTPAATEHI